MMMRYYVGVDIALRKSGLVVVNSDRDRTIAYHTIINLPYKTEPPQDMTYAADMRVLYARLKSEFAAIKEKYGEDGIVIIEDILSSAHRVSGMSIHAARTACTIAWIEVYGNTRDLYLYNPNEIKYYLTSSRVADKNRVLLGMKSYYPHYDYESLEEDEIDALALIMYHMDGEKPEKKKKRKLSTKNALKNVHIPKNKRELGDID